MAALSVKATYRSETRKITFSDNEFPSYGKLIDQVCVKTPNLHSEVLTAAPSCAGSFLHYPTSIRFIYRDFFSLPLPLLLVSSLGKMSTQRKSTTGMSPLIKGSRTLALFCALSSRTRPLASLLH